MELSAWTDYGDHNYGEFLYREFCNHVYLGQWELVRAFALTITTCQTIDKSYRSQVTETLRNLAENPYIVRNCWSKFPSPSYVSFLASQLLQEASGSNVKAIAHLSKINQFGVFLEECFPKLSEKNIQELAWMYTHLISVTNGHESPNNENVFFELSDEILEFFRTTLFLEPSVISLLLNELCSHNELEEFTETRTSIFNVVLYCLNVCIKQIESSFLKKNDEKYQEYLSKLCALLRLMPAWKVNLEIHDKLTVQFDRVFTKIALLCKKNVLPLNDVYDSLICRKSCDFIQFFSNIEDKNGIQISDGCYEVIWHNQTFDLQGAFLWSVKKHRHFLDSILSFCTEKVLAGEFADVQKLVSESLFTRLLPLIFLTSWSSCDTNEKFNNMVEATKLWIPADNDDAAVLNACNKFLTNISFKEKCTDYYVQQFPEAQSEDISRISKNIFTQLQMHSPLAVLQREFGLKHMNSSKVLTLLDCFTSDMNNPHLQSKTNWTALAAARDTTIFHGYRAIVLTMEAIMFCNQIGQNDQEVLNTTKVNRTEVEDKKIQMDTTKGLINDNALMEYLLNHSQKETYDKFVIERLDKARKAIKLLYPITYRIETLENLASLLFLSHKDLKEFPSDYPDSDEGHEGEEKYSNSSVKDTSIKSEKDDFDVRNIDVISKYLQTESDLAKGTRLAVKDNIKGTTDNSEPYSCHGSSRSGGSSGSSGISSTGFLCSELIVGDLLLLLKDSIVAVNADIFKSRSDSSSHDEQENCSDNPMNLDPKTDVVVEDIQKRLAQLMEFIKEAYWRYNLVKSDLFKATPSLDLPRVPKMASTNRSSSFNSYVPSSDNTDSCGSGAQKRKRKKKRKHMHRCYFSRDASSIGFGIIHYMLSRPDALLRYCLWRQNEEEAFGVINLCNLKSSPEATELTFSRQINQLCEKLKVSDNKERFNKINAARKEVKSSITDIYAIANAAVSGLESTSLSSIIDQEVHQWSIPQIQEIPNLANCTSPAEKALLIGSENLSSISLADIAYTRGVSLHQCVTILEMALLQWTQNLPNITSAQKKSFSFIPGNVKMIQLLLDLLRNMQSFLTDTDSVKINNVFFPHLENVSNYSEIFVNYIGPLNSLAFLNQVESWKVLSSHLPEVEGLLLDDVTSTDTCVNPKNKFHFAYKYLFKCVKDLSDWSTEVIRPHPTKYTNYLKKLYVYLQQVTGALLGCKDQNISVGLTSYTSYFSALKESPADILRNMIDQNKISEQKIEKFAVNMKVDLGQVLIQTFFPHVSLYREDTSDLMNSSSIETSVSVVSSCASIILNKSNEPWSSPRHPDLAARELLKDIISMAQDIAMANDSASIQTSIALLSLSKHSEIGSWMQDCSEIAYVDLDLLQTTEELKAFFINVTNLAWIHAILLTLLACNSDPISETSPCSATNFVYDTEGSSKEIDFHLPPIVSPFLIQRVMQQKTLCYSIGQLGAISLFDLRFNILHSNFPIPKHLNLQPYNILFLKERDLPSVWVKYTPKADPRQVFALSEGLLYSPKLQVLYSETLSEQLDDAMKDYLNASVAVDLENKSVELPQLLDLYSLDFDEGKDPSNSPFEGLLNFLMDFMAPNIAKPLEKLLSADHVPDSTSNSGSRKQGSFHVDLQPSSLKAGIKLQYIKSDLWDGVEMPISTIPPEPKILNYLNKHCPLVAYLFQVMSTNEFNHMSEDSASAFVLHKYAISNFLAQKWSLSCQVPSQDSSNASVKSEWFVSALSPAPLINYTLCEIQKCFDAKLWKVAIQYIDSFLEFHTSQYDSSFEFLRQLVLITLAGLSPNNGGHTWLWAISISDPTLRAKTVLLHFHKWEKEEAVEALKYCLSESADHDFVIPLRIKLREIELYQKILETSLSLENEFCDASSEAFGCWQDIAEKSVWDQSSILACIKNSGNYQLAVEWAELHVVNSGVKMFCSSMQLVWHLKQDPSQLNKATEILESCVDSASIECIELIEQVLPEVPSIKNKLFLVEFLVRMGMNYPEQCHYLNMILGLKMLNAVNVLDQREYHHLVAFPHLLLEQLLMNVEVNEAEQALKAVAEDLKSDNYMTVSLSPLSINQLLETYASKALEIPISDDISESNTTILDSEEVSFSMDHFVMPTTTPTREQWIPDSRIHVCQCCKQEQFNMFSRRHHCRRCGRVVCANCSQNNLVLERFGKYGVRACDDCYNQTMCSTISGRSTPPSRSFSLDKRYRLLSSIKSGGKRSSPLLSDFYVVKQRTNSIAASDVMCWTLTENEDHNNFMRNEFFYESAPSVSLCLSILKLHNNVGQCAKFMLGLCDHLINKLRPKASGKSNSEVDHYLVIGIIRTFLVNTKVKYHQIHDQESEALVDVYFERLEIIKMLVNAHCTHLIPKEDILSGETVRKLRDHVLEEERMSLALEISTNFGLDKMGVWSNWGMFCLRAGNWPAAREKFKQCLKVLKDRTKRTRENPTLHSVISYLEKCHYPGQGKAAAIYKTLNLREQILKGNIKVTQEVDTFDENVKEECLYYLNTYGSHFSTIAFFQRQSLIADALKYIFAEKCEPDCFVEALFMPALKHSQLSTLLQHLSMSDPNLIKWWPYLLSCCRSLQRTGYHNVLYQMQLFMGDYIRAAKSSIAFYLTPASSYSTVYFDRSHYLHNARKQFEMYLSKWRGNLNASSQIKNVLTLPEKEVKSYIRTIQCQEELAEYFKLCHPEDLKRLNENADRPDNPKSGQLIIPTLFSSWSKKSELISLVLVNAIKIDDGFDLAIKLIKEYQLPPTAVTCAAGRELIKLRWVEHLPHFIQNIRSYFSHTVDVDDVVMECLDVLVKQDGDVEPLIKMVTSDVKKINAHLLCGKLKNAYLLAIKLQRPQDVRRIMKAAEQTGQDAVKKFCERWLITNLQQKPNL